MADALAGRLAAIRRDAQDEADGLGPTRRAATRDVPVLVAAVEAVVNLAESWQQDQSRTAVGATSRRNGARILEFLAREPTGGESR